MEQKRKIVECKNKLHVIPPPPTLKVVAAALIPRLDLFISLIGALASSCLAIIFPAIIQLCTFWNYDQELEHELELRAAKDQTSLEEQRQKRRAKLDALEGKQQQHFGPAADQWSTGKCGKQQQLAGSQKGPTANLWQKQAHFLSQIAPTRRRLSWSLFVAKNCFLVLFGFVGLITGSWVSLAQLGVAGV